MDSWFLLKSNSGFYLVFLCELLNSQSKHKIISVDFP